MGAPQFIRTEAGEELVVITRADFDALLARAGDPAAEDVMTARIVERTDQALASGQDVALPESVWEEIEGGANPLAVVRKHRGLTQAKLSAAADVSQGFLSELEGGAKQPSLAVLTRLSRVLQVPGTVLFPQG